MADSSREEMPFWKLILLAILSALIVSAIASVLFDRPIEKDSKGADIRSKFEVMD